MNPAPIPDIPCLPGILPFKTCDSNGSTATICTSAFCSLKYLAHPVIVPPVPTPATKISNLPSRSSSICFPVIFS